MLEIEQKYRRADFAALERRLTEWGAKLTKEHTEADHYLNAPDRDFAQTDEAFRLRRIGEANYLTYKGPKQADVVKVRTELEVRLPDGERVAADFLQLFAYLGYRAVAVVRKHRRMYQLNRDGFALTICLDDAAGLGQYAEIEVLATEDRRDAARTVLADTAAALGLTEVERRSYLGLTLAARESGS